MSKTENDRDQALIAQITDLAIDRVAPEQSALVMNFLRHYYGAIAAIEISDKSATDLCAAALSHWRFAEVREPGTARVRVYNPETERDGWRSPHTAVDIVADDSPFLVDSLRMAFNKQRLSRYLIIHPVLRVCRNQLGQATSVGAHHETLDGALPEAFIHFEVRRQTDAALVEKLRRELETVLATVKLVVGDWTAMREKLGQSIGEIESLAIDLPAAERSEAVALLAWLGDDHFTFLGCRDYTLEQYDDDELLREVPDSGLGLLRNPGSRDPSASFLGLPPEIRKLAKRRELVVPSKANTRSSIHRPGYHDYVGVKQFDADGNVIGERRFVGLYASAVYNSSVLEIPWLRARVRNVLEHSPYPLNSHGGQALLNILENYPRDELFHVDEHALFETVMGILRLQDHHRVGVFVHRERFGRFYSCLVYIPRDRFNTQVRGRIQKILEQTFDTTKVEVNVQINESTLARLYFVLRVAPDSAADYDAADLEKQIRLAARAWTDDLHEAIVENFGEERAAPLLRRYVDAFKGDYRESYSPQAAVADIELMESLQERGERLTLALSKPREGADDRLNLKLFNAGGPVSLSEALEMLENMGLRIDASRPSRIERADAETIWIYDFEMAHDEGPEFDIDDAVERFHEAFLRAWAGDVENDAFNHLIIRARLSWRQVTVLRACSKYLRQARVPFSQDYMQQTLCANPGITRLLIELFESRFDPASADEEHTRALNERFELELDRVSALDEDRILRAFAALINATLRTNHYQADGNGQPKPYLSLKLDPQRLPNLPEPRPQYEIFVYSPRVEGVHLRGGKVARGGLRWSDRREDFRAEVLGLMKAQMAKNAVIVPVGAKGGFVPKSLRPDADRGSAIAEAKECYRIFIRGLLDVTDNIDGDNVVPPANVVRHDGDDPYLVVAADKGTATFSDIANEIAAEYGFWLGDAFASGGSMGYDHKAMGITARGAWESVRRHLATTGVDPATTSFTVVGIGDMSGDVFGNGMLLSSNIRLVGAFNHAHIFLDPDPDPRASFAERQRLFALPQSSWDDYDASLISAGGGVYSRDRKNIEISPEMRVVLGIDATSLSPHELISALLKARVDLLWNGGIGTYVKSSREQNADVGDRANDAVRVDGRQLRCRVLVEGGNLGCTQAGRIEFASNGGRLHTDSIDNSAGVDCSDHEVNIKILLNRSIHDGELGMPERNALLAEMTDDIADLVIRTNYLQTQALACAVWQAPAMLDVHARLIDSLELAGRLDRQIEFLPDAEAIEDRRRNHFGLCSPELSVLMGYTKLALFDELLGSDLPDSPAFCAELVGYFPRRLQQDFTAAMSAHPLAREITSNVIVNEVVNRGGITFVFRTKEETGASVADIVRAYVIARDIFAQPHFWARVEALDNAIPVQAQIELLLEARKLVERAARWLLRSRPHQLDVRSSTAYFRPGIADLTERLGALVESDAETAMAARRLRFMNAGAPEGLAFEAALYHELIAGLDIVQVAELAGVTIEEAAALYFRIGAELDLHWVRDQIDALPRERRWQALARASLREDLAAQHQLLTADVLQARGIEESAGGRLKRWLTSRSRSAERCAGLIAELKSIGSADTSQLSAALREIRGLHRGELDVTRGELATKQRAGRDSEAAA